MTVTEKKIPCIFSPLIVVPKFVVTKVIVTEMSYIQVDVIVCNEGSWVASNRDQLVQRIQYILRKYQAELQASIIKMMDGLPAKIRKAQSEGLNSVL